MTVGFIGLGKMGSQMVMRLLKAGHEVVVTDLNEAAINTAVEQGAKPAADREALVQASGAPAVIWLMIPAHLVDAEIDALLQIIPKKSIIIDGGNSDFRSTRQRARRCLDVGVQLVDVGTSGGILGLKHGFSMMVGGDAQAFKKVEPLIEALATTDGYKYFGPAGAGHYIKMIHNAIEYGVMEAYAEGYHLLKDGADYPGLDLAAIAEVWQHGSIIASSLNGVAETALKANPQMEGVSGYVAESGETRWTLEVASQQDVVLPAIQTALDDRVASENGEVSFATKLLAEMRNIFGGHPINKTDA